MSSRLAQTLFGDIGATNARFSLFANGVLGPVAWFEVARHPRFQDAVAEFLRGQRGEAPVAAALIAVAGPVVEGRSVLTNCPWVIDARELQVTFGFKHVRIVNDFEAAAYSLPHLTAADLQPIGGGRAVAGAPMAVLGPGSGLGVACLVRGPGRPAVVASEGGHATLAATSEREAALIDHLRRHFGHVSAERVISGMGLENIYRAVAALDANEVPARTAAEITKAALDGSCRSAQAALAAFCGFLGAFAGNVALMFGARGGLYVAGGIVPRIVEFTRRSQFREQFEAKGRFRPYLEAIPSNLIVHPAATFVGLQSLVESDPEIAP
jgi:glucokinase